MKNTIIFLLSFAVVSLGYAQQIPDAPADKAVVYFVRPSSLGFAINFSYFDSTKLIGRFNGPKYIRYECEPGYHLFWVRSENRDFVEAELEAGRIYFIEAIVKMGAIKAAVEFQPLLPGDTKRMIAVRRLMSKKSGESFSTEQLNYEAATLKDVVDRAMEKYRKDKQDGKQFPHLKKEMYHTFKTDPLKAKFIEAATHPALDAIELFNGIDLNGWHSDVPDMDKDSLINSPFIVRDGRLVSLGTPEGHLITDTSYSNYRLEVKYRFAGTPGNCGILIHASTPRALYGMFPKSLEVQMMHENAGDFWCIVEDITVPDMEKRRGPKEKWGITEGKERRIVNLTDGSEKPLGQWNVMVIECKGNTIKVWVNETLVNYGFDCTATQGHIAVQAEGSEVEFEYVKLSPL